jgi:DNA-directed RNA polymerase subunit RPC12/RpoP
MPECESCGANIDNGEIECPYCGHSQIKSATTARLGTKDTSAYSLDREVGTIQFGDGEKGTRPESGKDNVSASYRYGEGATGSLVCSNCKLENPETRIDCEACGTPLRKHEFRLRE